MQLVHTDRGFRSSHQLKADKQSLLPGLAPERWVHVAFTGNFVFEGEEVVLTTDVFQSFIKNFEAQENPMPIFLDHETGAAEGWVKKLRLQGQDLFALMEFGKDVEADIRKGKWRFTSIGFTLEGVSRETGEPIGPEMFEVSLTNEPFLDGQQPLKLNKSAGKKARKIQMATASEIIQKALKDGSTLAEFAEAIAAIQGAPSEDAPPTEPSVEASTEPAADDVQMQDGDEALAAGGEAIALLMEATGLGAAEVLAAIRENIESIASSIKGSSSEEGTPAESIAQSNPDAGGDVQMSKALEIRVNALEAENKKLRERVDARDAADLEGEVDGWVESGNILPADRDEALSFMRKDAKAARKIFGSRKVVPVGENLEDESPETDPTKITLAKMSQKHQNTVRALAHLRGWNIEKATKRVAQIVARNNEGAN